MRELRRPRFPLRRGPCPHSLGLRSLSVDGAAVTTAVNSVGGRCSARSARLERVQGIGEAVPRESDGFGCKYTACEEHWEGLQPLERAWDEEAGTRYPDPRL